MNAASQTLTDGLAAAERLLLKLRHDPAAIVLTLGAPVALVVIFGYIFGSAISVPGEIVSPSSSFSSSPGSIGSVSSRAGIVKLSD